MPELPDIEVFSRNLHDALAGMKLLKVKVIGGKNISGTSASFNTRLKNKTLEKIYRSGKEMRFLFSDGTLMGLHLMLTGDLFLFDKKNERKSTLAEFYFEDNAGLAVTDRMKNAFIKLDPIDKKGPDALSPGLNFKYLKEAMQRKKNIKKLLTDQDIIRGIGNSYSDEILWRARISPYSAANAIPDDKIKELLMHIKKVLKDEIKNIYKNHPGKINGEVKEYLQIHTKQQVKSPTGAAIIIDKSGMMKTYYTREQKLYT